MVREIIIDGYNLMHAAHLARANYGPGDLERCRKRLLVRLVQLIEPSSQVPVTIVFDAKAPPPDLPDRARFKMLLIRYAQDHAEADDLIEELIHQHSAPRGLLVVSGDRRLRQAARRRGALPISGEAFLELLETEAEDQTRTGPHVTHAARPSLQSLDLGDDFAAVDVAAILREVEAESRDRRSEPPTATNPRTPSGSVQITLSGVPHASIPPGSTEGGTSAESLPVSPERSSILDSEIEFWRARIAEISADHLDEPPAGTNNS